MKSDHRIVIGIIGVGLVIVYLLTGGGMAVDSKIEPGKIMQLTTENLAMAQRAGTLLALYTKPDQVESTNEMRSLQRRAAEYKEQAVVGHGNTAEDPELVGRADLRLFPAWILYKNGIEVARVEGEAIIGNLEKMLVDNLAVGTR